METKLEERKGIGCCDKFKFGFLFGIQADYYRMTGFELLRKGAAAMGGIEEEEDTPDTIPG
jgi:hypothetical protein